jgi:hypothetical protein
MPSRPSKPLPSYRGILAVDTERFSSNPSARQPDLSAAVQDVLRTAFERCGLPELWEQRRFPQSTGDGFLIGVYSEQIPFLVHPLLDSLHDALSTKDERLRTIDRALRLRLRVSINIGPVPDSGDEQRDRVGTPMNNTFRLLNSEVLKDALKRTNPDVTFLAAIISQRVFEDVIRGGYTPAKHADEFEPVTAEVPDKDFAEAAWLYIPRSSRGGASGTEGPAGADKPTGDGPQGPKSGRLYQNFGEQQVNVEQIHGGVSYKGRHG